MSDEEAFREAIQTAVQNELTPQRARSILESDDGYDDALWQLMGELGWLSIHVPDRYGGLGGTFAEACIVLHELGKTIAPSPYFSSAVLATTALLGGFSERLREVYLPRLASGEVRGTFAFTGPSGQLADLGVRFASHMDGVVLSGQADFVLDAHLADFIIVCALSEAGQPAMFLVQTRQPGVEISLVPSFDRTRRICSVRFDQVHVPDSEVVAGTDYGAGLLEHLIQVAGIGLAAESVGGAEQVLDTTVDYVKTRQQFGRAIGSFQAVKHGCAEMLVQVETARVAAESAARSVKLGESLSPADAAIAKSYAVPAYYSVAGSGMQYHGGISYTWEHDVHFHLKRATFSRTLFGLPSWHVDRLARIILDGPDDEDDLG